MYRPLLAVAVLLLLVTLGASQAMALSTVTLQPSRTTLGLGETLEVTILADFSDPIVGWGLDLVIDPAYLSVDAAPSIDAAWSPVAGMDGDGLAGAAFPVGLSGSVGLATVTLVADSVGVSVLTLEVTQADATEGFAYDPDFASGFDSWQLAGSVEITVIPEPAPVALLAAGLVVLGARRRRAAQSAT